MKLNRKVLIGFIICLLIFPVLYFTADKIPVIGTGPLSPGKAPGKKVSLDWNVTSLDGETKSMGNVSGGEILFLNFWATWCPPCVEEMPSIEKLYNRFKGRITFACISDDSIDKLRAFRDANRLTVPIYHIENPPPDEFGVRGIPTTFIISAKGEILQRHVGGADWAQKSVVDYLDMLLGETAEIE